MVFVKICGITTEEDGLLAVAMGADAIGFVFAPSSRQIAPARAGDIAKRLPPEVLTVGVFRGEAPKRVVEIINRHGIGAAQLHGNESVEDTQYVAERVPRTMKAFVAGSHQASTAKRWGTDPILVDAAVPGSGESYDYALARDVPRGLHVVLAGGLTPANVGRAIEVARPWGVDVSSGVESSPGRKDPLAVAEFVRAAKEAGEALPKEVHEEPTAPYDWDADSAF